MSLIGFCVFHRLDDKVVFFTDLLSSINKFAANIFMRFSFENTQCFSIAHHVTINISIFINLLIVEVQYLLCDVFCGISFL